MSVAPHHPDPFLFFRPFSCSQFDQLPSISSWVPRFNNAPAENCIGSVNTIEDGIEAVVTPVASAEVAPVQLEAVTESEASSNRFKGNKDIEPASHGKVRRLKGGQRKSTKLRFSKKVIPLHERTYKMNNILGQLPANSGNSPSMFLVLTDTGKKIYIEAEQLRMTSSASVELFMDLPVSERELWEFAYIIAERSTVHPFTGLWTKAYQLAWSAEGYDPTWVLECHIHIEGGNITDLPRGKKGYENAIKQSQHAWMKGMRLQAKAGTMRWVPCRAVASKRQN